jgi:hypothetical protein
MGVAAALFASRGGAWQLSERVEVSLECRRAGGRATEGHLAQATGGKGEWQANRPRRVPNHKSKLRKFANQLLCR